MMRRLRIAVRPNVRPGGRGLSSTRDAQPVCGSANDDRDHERASQRGGTEGGVQKVAEDQPDEIESSNHAPKNTRCSQPEKDSSNLGGKHQNGEASTCSDQPVSSWQRQKRFCSIPNLTKTRMMLGPTHSSRRTPRSPAKKAVAGPLAEVMTADSEGQLQSNSGSSHDLRSPSRQKASGSGKQAKIEGRPVPLSPASKNQSDSSQGRKLVSKKPLCLEGSSSEGVEKQQDTALSHSRALPPESFPVTAKLSQSTGSFAKVQPPLSTLTSRNQSISFDHTRVMKAHKLRELLKREWRKERKQKKSKSHTFECNAAHDRNKMTMADLIYYLPDTNPMKSYLVDEIKQTEKILPSSPPRNLTEDLQEDDVEDDSQIEDADNDPAQDAQLAVPRVKVAEDGSLIIDEESLTIEVSRVKGPNTVEENDPIFERGSSTTYTSFRKTSYTKPWTDKETDMFFLAISMVGTDFSMIGQLFPHRERAEIKNKFKKEERANSWRIDKAFREKCRFDLSYFNTLLKKSLAEEEKKREKCKPESLIKKTTARKLPSKQKDKNIAPTHQTAEGETDNEVVEMDSEMAEKENEDCSNVIGLTNEEAAFQKKHKARAEEVEVEDSSSERHTNGRKTVNCSNEDDAVDLVTETPASDIDGKRLEAPDLPEGGRKGPVIKPTQLSRGLLQKPLPNLGKHWVKKMMGMKEKPCDEAKTACEHYKEDGATEVSAEAGEYLDKKPRQSKRQARGAVSLKDDEKAQAEDTEDELDLMAVQEQMLNKPTRSGRIPKISQALQQAGEEDSPDECSPTSPPPLSKASPKQQRRRVKPKPNLDMSKKSRGASRSKLVTLRASLPEDCEEEEQNEVRPEEPYSYPINPEEQNQAPAFVPLSLRSPEPVRLEVEESMEELEISVNVPDVLDVEETQGSLCSQSECPDVQEEVTVTTEHQLDLHVDVMEFLSPEHVEVVSKSEESSSEAAQTLLTIRNPERLSLVSSSCSTDESVGEEPTIQKPEREDTAMMYDQPEHTEQTLFVTEASLITTPDISNPHQSEPKSAEHLDTVPETCQTKAVLTEACPLPLSCQERNVDDSRNDAEDTMSDLGSFHKAPQIRKSRFSKPRPNLGGIVRTHQGQLNQSTVPTCLKHAVDSASSSVSVKPFERERSDSESIFKDTILEESKNEGSSVKKTEEKSQGSSNSQKGAQSSDTLPQRTTESQSRRSRFPKPKPNLGRAARNLQRAAPQTYSGPDTDAESPTEEVPARAKRTDMHAVKTSMGEAPNNEMREPSCEAAAFEKKKATKLHTEEGRAVFTPSDTSEAQFTHQEPTIILTLIQIPTSPVDGYESSCVPVSTVTAELLSPVVFVDAQSECQSRDPLTAAEVHVTGGCSSISDFMVNNPLEEHGGGVGPTITREKCGAERSRNLCEEEDISLSLEELGHSLDAGSKDAGADAAPPLKKRTSPPIKTSRARQRNSFSKEEDIPQSLTLEESVDSLDVGSEESSVGTVPPLKKRRLSIETRTGSSKNVPANPSKEESMDPGDEPTPSVPVSMLFKDNNPTAVAIYTQQCPTEALVTAAQELSQGIVGHDDLLKQDTGAAVAVEILDSSGEKEPEPNHQITPLASDGPLTRPGRKPRGFLSFISNKTGPGCASTARTGRLTSQRPLVNTARAERRKTSLVAPTETVTNSPATKDVCSNVTVGLSRGRQTHELASSPVSTSPQSQASCVKPTGSKGNGKEPTNVTEYIFSDIFTEVEERDGHQL